MINRLDSPKNNSPDSNHYAFPLDFMAIVDLVEMKVIKICHLPLGAEAITSKHIGPRKVSSDSCYRMVE